MESDLFDYILAECRKLPLVFIPANLLESILGGIGEPQTSRPGPQVKARLDGWCAANNVTYSFKAGTGEYVFVKV